ncbi:hypothetical protein DFJ73DRAFT_860497 [Zopfochytrium polystomum]|nr:hypothetical protein DFJ73DRAFT_860497 [Zopfochytrium polystomum]
MSNHDEGASLLPPPSSSSSAPSPAAAAADVGFTPAATEPSSFSHASSSIASRHPPPAAAAATLTTTTATATATTANTPTTTPFSHYKTSIIVTEDGTETVVRVADDGVSYQWDPAKSAWFPMWDEQLMQSQQSVYRKEGVDETAPVPTFQRKRKIYTAADEFSAQSGFPDTASTPHSGAAAEGTAGQGAAAAAAGSAKKRQKPPPAKKPNTSVYISGLPPDVTFTELVDIFSKYGILMEDASTGEPRIKIYKDAAGNVKGDALVTYFKPESVDLCVSLMDDAELRPGEGWRISVQEAVFKEKEKDAPASASATASKSATGASNAGTTAAAAQQKSSNQPTKMEKKVLQKKMQKLEKRLDWFEEEEGKKSAKLSKIVVLKHMFTKEEIDQDPTLLLDLKQDVRDECEKFGEVTNVILYDHSDDGVMTVRFKEQEAAERCVERNDGRFFAGRKIAAYLYDGKEKFKETKTQADIEAEEAKRLAAYEAWLESQH